MRPSLQRLREVLERPHGLGMIGGELDDQLAHCVSFSLVIAQFFGADAPSLAIDLGTGGGLPGLALACEWPQTDWTLVDIRAGRTAEVERAVLSLRLRDRVSVLSVHAQELGHELEFREQADLVVARAFGSVDLTAECAAGLLRVGGVLVASEPPTQDVERWPVAGLDACGFEAPSYHDVGGHHFVSIVKSSRLSMDLPRLPPRSDRGWPGR